MSIIVQHRRDSRTNCEANTPAAGEIWQDTTLTALRFGDGATLGGYLVKRWGYNYPLSPPQITADQNNYAPTDFAISETLFVTSDAARTITGIAGGYTGARRTLINRGAFDITLSNANAASTAANRFLFEADVVIRAGGSIDLQYSAADSRWMRANGGTKVSTIPQELLLTGSITPAQIVANQNDYAPTNVTLATTLRLSTDASRNLTGIADARDGAVKIVLNAGGNPLVLKNADAGSTAANRFDFGADITLSGKQSVTIRYDGTDARWKLVARTDGQAIAAGSVTAQTVGASALGVSMINGTLIGSVAGSALTIAIKTLAGADPTAADPVYVLFRDFSAATGDYVVMTLTAATSFVVSSGSSLGVAVNNQAFRIWIVAINDAGTFRLGVINCLSGNDVFPLGGWGFAAASTAEGGAGAADSAQTFYTGTATAGKVYATLGYASWESGLAAAGTWSAGPTRLQLYGPGVKLPGDIVQSVRQDTASVATGTTVVPFDDTVPQNTEGDQYLSKAITPSSNANLLRARAQLSLACSAVQNVTVALFRDAVAGAVAAQAFSIANTDYVVQPAIDYAVVGNAASTTFKVRAGVAVSGTVTFNGKNAARLFGGVANSALVIDEIMT